MSIDEKYGPAWKRLEQLPGETLESFLKRRKIAEKDGEVEGKEDCLPNGARIRGKILADEHQDVQRLVNQAWGEFEVDLRNRRWIEQYNLAKGGWKWRDIAMEFRRLFESQPTLSKKPDRVLERLIRETQVDEEMARDAAKEKRARGEELNAVEQAAAESVWEDPRRPENANVLLDLQVRALRICEKRFGLPRGYRASLMKKVWGLDEASLGSKSGLMEIIALVGAKGVRGRRGVVAPKGFMSVRDVCTMAGVCSLTAYRWVHTGKVVSARQENGDIVVSKESFEAFMAKGRIMAIEDEPTPRKPLTGARGRAKQAAFMGRVNAELERSEEEQQLAEERKIDEENLQVDGIEQSEVVDDKKWKQYVDVLRISGETEVPAAEEDHNARVSKMIAGATRVPGIAPPEPTQVAEESQYELPSGEASSQLNPTPSGRAPVFRGLAGAVRDPQIEVDRNDENDESGGDVRAPRVPAPRKLRGVR